MNTLSRTWWLTTNSDRELEDVFQWLKETQRWSENSFDGQNHRVVARTVDSTVTLICVDIAKHRPGSAKTAIGKIGTSSTLVFTQELSGQIDHCGRLDEIYRFALSFAEWDDKCDFYFELEDRGILKRVDKNYTVNPDQFFAQSLANMLTFDYSLADSDKRNDLMVTDT